MGTARQTFASMARNGQLVRVLSAYTLFILSEYLLWIAVLVWACAPGSASAPTSRPESASEMCLDNVCCLTMS